MFKSTERAVSSSSDASLCIYKVSGLLTLALELLLAVRKCQQLCSHCLNVKKLLRLVFQICIKSTILKWLFGGQTLLWKGDAKREGVCGKVCITECLCDQWGNERVVMEMKIQIYTLKLLFWPFYLIAINHIEWSASRVTVDTAVLRQKDFRQGSWHSRPRYQHPFAPEVGWTVNCSGWGCGEQNINAGSLLQSGKRVIDGEKYHVLFFNDKKWPQFCLLAIHYPLNVLSGKTLTLVLNTRSFLITTLFFQVIFLFSYYF